MGFNKGLVICGLIASAAFIVLAGFAFELSDTYGFTVDDEFNDTFNAYSQTRQLTSEFDNIIEGGDVNPEGQDQAVYKNVVVVGKVSRQSANLAVDMIQQTPKVLGMPPAIIGIIITLVFVLSAFGFIAMLSRRNP